MWAFQHIRVRVMKLQEKGSYPYYLLKKHWKILTKYYGDLSSKHFYDYHLKTHITPLEIHEILATLQHDLKQALVFKDTFFEALRSMNAKEACEFLPDYIHQLKQSKILEFKPFITTLKNWQEEIIQCFIDLVKKPAKSLDLIMRAPSLKE